MRYVCIKETIEPPFIGGAIAVCQEIGLKDKVNIIVDGKSLTVSKENLLDMGNSEEEVEVNWTRLKLEQLPVIKESSLIAIILKDGKPESVIPASTNALFDLSCSMSEQPPWNWKSFAEFVDEYVKEESKPAVYLWEADSENFNFSLANIPANLNVKKEIPRNPLGLLTSLYGISLALVNRKD